MFLALGIKCSLKMGFHNLQVILVIFLLEQYDFTHVLSIR
jgi:hypothetical protein